MESSNRYARGHRDMSSPRSYDAGRVTSKVQLKVQHAQHQKVAMSKSYQPRATKKKIEVKTQHYDETRRRMKDYDFNYIFYRANQMKFLDLGIDAINKLHHEEDKWLRQEMNKSGISFVIEKLSSMFQVEIGPASESPDHYDLNKLTWAELFMKQPDIQTLFNNFLEQLQMLLNQEFVQNKEQLRNFLKFPRFTKKAFEHPQSYTCNSKAAVHREMISSLQKQDGQPIGRTYAYVTQKGQRNQQLNRRQSALNHLRGKGYIEEHEIHEHPDRQDGKKSVKAFFAKLPAIIKKKNSRLIYRIQEFIMSETAAKTKFEQIINNNELFAEKMERLIKLQGEFEQNHLRKENLRYVQESIDRIGATIQRIENEGHELDNQIIELQDNSKFEKIRRKKPTVKLLKELEDWQVELEEMHMDDAEISKFQNEFWEVQENFEVQIQQEEKGWELERSGISTFWLNRERQLKQHYLFKIEAMEVAMQEIKMDCLQKVNRIEMQLADYESQQVNLNILNKFETIENFIADQQLFFKEVGLDKLKEFESPFKNKSSVHIQNEKERYKANTRLSKKGTSMIFPRDEKDGSPAETTTELSDYNLQLDELDDGGFSDDRIKMNKKVGVQNFSVNPLQVPQPSVGSLSRQRIDRLSGTVTVDIDHMLLLASKMNHYFRVIKQLLSNIEQADQTLGFKDFLIAEAEEDKKAMHTKCVKYQDLVHGLFKILTQLLSETKLITGTEALSIRLLTQVQDMKLTLDVNQIDKVIEAMDSFEFERKVENLRNINNSIFNQIALMSQIYQEIEGTKWLTRKMEDVKHPDQSRGKAPVKKPSNQSQKENDEKELANLIQKSQIILDKVLALLDMTSRDVLEVRLNIETNNQRNTVSYQPSEHEQVPERRAAKNAQATKRRSSIKAPQRKDAAPNVQSAAALGNATITRQETRRQTSQLSLLQRQASLLPLQYQQTMGGHRRVSPEKTFGSQLMAGSSHQPWQSRMTFFGETSDTAIKSHSKKKIFMLYDQFSNTNVPQKQVSLVHKALAEDAIGRQLLKMRKGNGGGSASSYEFSSASQADSSFETSDDPESPMDFEGIINSLNNELHRLFIINSLERCKETDRKLKKKEGQLVQPVDCIKIEPYCSPQINLVPLKLLMLKKKYGPARAMLTECLHIIARLYPQTETSKQNQTYLREHLFRRTSSQTEKWVDNKKSQFEQIQESLLPFIETEQQRIRDDVEKDLIFIDELHERMELFRIIKQSFRFSDNEEQFLQDFNTRFIDLLRVAENTGKAKAQMEMEKQIDELEKQVIEISEHQASEAMSQAMSGDASKRGAQQQQQTSSKLSKTLQNIKSLRSGSVSKTVKTLSDLAEMRIDDATEIQEILVSEFAKLKEQDLSSSSRDQKSTGRRNEQIVLPRQAELIQKGMRTITEDILEAMDKKRKQMKSAVPRPSRQIYQVATKVPQQVTSAGASPMATDVPGIINLELDDVQTEFMNQVNVADAFTQQTPHTSKKFITQAINTDVSMHDLQMLLEFKQRSVQKIKQLEEVVQHQKDALHGNQNKVKRIENALNSNQKNCEKNEDLVTQATEFLHMFRNHAMQQTLVCENLPIRQQSVGKSASPIAQIQRASLQSQVKLPGQLQPNSNWRTSTSKNGLAPQGKQALTNILIQRGSHNLKNSNERLQGVSTSTFKKNVQTLDVAREKKLLGRNKDLQTSKQDDAEDLLKMEEKSDGDVLYRYFVAELPKPEVRRVDQSISEKSGKLNDENNDEYININVNDIDMLHQEQAFRGKDAHSSKEMVKSFEGRYDKLKQERGGDTDLRGSAEHDVLGSSPRADHGIKVQVRPQSSICGHNGLFGQRRYFEQASKTQLKDSKGLQRYGKSFGKISQSNFLNTKNKKSVILRNVAASQSHKDIRTLVSSYETSDDGHAHSNVFAVALRPGNKTTLEVGGKARLLNSGLASSLKTIAHSVVPRGAGGMEATSTGNGTSSYVNLSRHLSTAKPWMFKTVQGAQEKALSLSQPHLRATRDLPTKTRNLHLEDQHHYLTSNQVLVKSSRFGDTQTHTHASEDINQGSALSHLGEREGRDITKFNNLLRSPIERPQTRNPQNQHRPHQAPDKKRRLQTAHNQSKKGME